MSDKEYKALQKNAIEFAKKELTKESFGKSGDEAINKKVGTFSLKGDAYELLKNDLLPKLEKEKIDGTADAGTMLGAIRHKGFIPGDDDIDLLIKYEDFLKLKNKYPNNIVSSEDKGYPLLFAKGVPDKGLFNSSIPSIDLFITIPTTKKKLRRFRSLRNNVRFSLQTINRSKFKKFNGQMKILGVVQGLLFLNPFCGRKLTLDKAYKKLVVPLEKAEFYYSLENPTRSYKRNKNPLDLYDTQKMKFEDIKINISKKYDEVLTSRYGENYMTPYKGKYVFDHISPLSIKLVKTKDLEKIKNKG